MPDADGTAPGAPPPPPQYSPDGRWWWTGREWVPAPAPGARVADDAPSSPIETPSPSQSVRERAWYQTPAGTGKPMAQRGVSTGLVIVILVILGLFTYVVIKSIDEKRERSDELEQIGEDLGIGSRGLEIRSPLDMSDLRDRSRGRRRFGPGVVPAHRLSEPVHKSRDVALADPVRDSSE